MIPPATLAGITAYVEHHRPPGGFLRAVLENDLREAFGRADSENTRAMGEIVAYLYNHVPSLCWGSAAKVEAWLNPGGDISDHADIDGT